MNLYDIKGSIVRGVNLAHPELDFDLQVSDVSFGKPELYLQGDCNSRILLTALDASIHFKNQGYVFYDRLRLDYYLTGIRVPGKPSDYSDTQAVVQALVDKYQLPLVPTEFTYAGVFHKTVELKPLDTCVGFFTNFTATLGFIDDRAFVTSGLKVALQSWTITANGVNYERRSMAKTITQPGQAPYLGGTNINYFTIGENTQVEIRAVECGGDTVSGVAGWNWVSVQFYGPVDETQMSSFVVLNGVWGRLVHSGYDASVNLTSRTYRMESAINPIVNQALSLDF